jgi:hypothetical protein
MSSCARSFRARLPTAIQGRTASGTLPCSCFYEGLAVSKASERLRNGAVEWDAPRAPSSQRGSGLAQLLDDPSARRMLRDVNVQDAPPIMTDDKESVRRAERNRWHREEIHGGNRFPMVLKESQPALGPARISRRSFHPTGDGSLGKIQTEHEEFPMYPRRSPGWILDDHTEDQLANLQLLGSPTHYPKRRFDKTSRYMRATIFREAWICYFRSYFRAFS